MDNLFNSGISIETMAAFLDGNLSADEMQSMSSLIGENDGMRMIVDASSVIDDTLSAYSPNELELPSELQSFDFVLPNLDSEISGLVTLSPEPVLEDVTVAAACADVPEVQFGGEDFGSSEINVNSDIGDLLSGHDNLDIDNDASSLGMSMDDSII